MKKYILPLVAICFLTISAFAQEEEKKKDRPVAEPFFGGVLIDAQTTYIQPEKTLNFVIQHKFGEVGNGFEDIFGIYHSANVRLGLDYVVYKNLQVGWGLTRTDMTHDFNVKYTILEQTRKNTIPVAVGIYGNMGISQKDESSFGTEYQFTDRMSYFGQLIIGRKFHDRVSLQAGVSFSHFNQVDTSKHSYDRIGLHFNGRIKVTPLGSFIFNYDQPLRLLQLSSREDDNMSPNLTFGWEIATVTHSFQIYMGYSKEILPQYYMIHNQNEFDFNMFHIGFTINRFWNF